MQLYQVMSTVLIRHIEIHPNRHEILVTLLCKKKNPEYALNKSTILRLEWLKSQPPRLKKMFRCALWYIQPELAVVMRGHSCKEIKLEDNRNNLRWSERQYSN